MRVLYLTHYFHPEGNAPATRVYELSRRWAAEGHEVTVVTCAPNVPNGVVYEGYANRMWQRECREGVDVIRVWTYLAANQGTVRRILNYVSYMATATLVGLFLRRPDVVIATSPQFFCGWAGVLLSRLRGLRFVLEIRDLWPESISAVDAIRNRAVVRFLEFLELRLYAAAGRIVTVGDGYRERLEARGVDRARITVIPNGVDLEAFAPDRPAGEREALRRDFDLGDRFVCAYVGTIGMGSGLEVVLRACRRLRDSGRDDIRFLLVGDGALREELEAQARAEGLQSVIFTGRQPKARIPEFLAAVDACLVHLTRSPLFTTVLPSKIFEAAAMRRAIVVGVEGFAARMVSEAEAGLCMEPENEGELLRAVERLAVDPDLAKQLGASGYEKIALRHSYDGLAASYLELLQGGRLGVEN